MPKNNACKYLLTEDDGMTVMMMMRVEDDETHIMGGAKFAYGYTLASARPCAPHPDQEKLIKFLVSKLVEPQLRPWLARTGSRRYVIKGPPNGPLTKFRRMLTITSFRRR